MEQGTALLFAHLMRLDDNRVGQPTALPGWTRGHLLTHLARQAEGFGRLLAWARTGVRTPMYENWERRNADIAAGAGRPLSELLADVRATTEALEAAITTLPEAAWSATVMTGQGEEIAAHVVPWLRAREVSLHTLDLDLAATWQELVPSFVDAVLDEATRDFANRSGLPALSLRPADRDRSWAWGDGPPITLEGPASALLAWLIGRAGGGAVHRVGGGELPQLPAWL
jgi:maleylpyruvate isomerase